MNKSQIGIQLYTLRTLTATDFDGTLAQVAAAGYPGVEFAGFGDLSAAEMRGLLDQHGLKAFSAHIPLQAFEASIDQVISDLQTIGATYGIVPWIAPEARSFANFQKLGEQFNEYGTKLQAAGLKFAYHNHNFEFEEKSEAGQTIWDALIQNTEPGVVSF